MIKLDYSQHQCPYPVIETRKQILANPGQALEVLVSDQAGRDNVTRLAEKMNYQASATAVGNNFRLNLTPAAGESDVTPVNQAVNESAITGKTVIYCGSDRMGQGDDEFGRVLMRNFLTTLLEMEPLPDIILFVNSGINLTTEGSDILEALQTLVSRGVDIASCGLCLDFYQKKDLLKVGRTTNMFEMVEVQCQAGRIICP
ncbi:selenium metabolism protein YedF [Desulfuromusa kysingii]|uniref:Selenium metabolism protein YedF n=1 Tax=Desulfuromusa kysingii TaxID=37625 RepID=A0A1H3WC69_9BACT|nr:sulfurtransferase-like selenium metabolism protein YedF [Desulfuromusa kysingii]SDZ83942.1 selenium metabolism protein YedF [Desulfuromusa kysingii]